MKLFGIALVFLSFVFGGAVLARRYISVLEGVERAEKLVAALADGVRREHGTMEEILRGVLKTDDKTECFVNAVLKNSAGKRIVLKKETAAETGFCSDGFANKLLLEAFDFFGKTDAAEQALRLEHIQSSLCKRREQLTKPTYERAKLARSFGVIAGFLAAVILI